MQADLSIVHRPGRRRYSAAYKAQVMAQCGQEGVSIASVAMAHGLNANLVQKWLSQARLRALPEPAKPAFVPMPIQASRIGSHIEVQLRRGEVQVEVRWPVDQAPACAVWLRELLR
jgi:transposase-like protein